jgi:cation transporter-like permease
MTYSAKVNDFFAAFKETLGGHLFGVGGIIAGFIVASGLNVFQSVPWAIAVYPEVLIGSSVITGIFSGRLNTALHVGTILPRFSGNTRTLRRLFQPVLALTLVSSVMTSLASMLFGSLFWGVAFPNFLDILVVVVATMALGLTIYLIALPVTFTAFRKGLDLDRVAYPVVATVGDLLTTASYALMINLFFNLDYRGRYSVFLVAILPVLLMLYALPRSIHDKDFIKAIKASVLALVFVAFVANVTGTILLRMSAVATSRNAVFSQASLLTAYPALLELVADAGSVIGSTATAKLVLGLMEPYLFGMKNNAPEILGAWAASVIAFIFFSAASLLVTRTFALPAFSTFVCLLLVANVLALVATILIYSAFALLTFKRSLDPDHFVVPVENSLSSTVASAALLVALVLLSHPAG